MRPATLQIVDEAREHVFRGQWTKSYQSVFNAKFFVGEIISFVDDGSGESRALESTLPDEHYHPIV
jgi:hypothetical protein